MSCKKCQQKKPCTTTNDCACEVYLTSDCVNNVKTEFECLNISNGLSLTETLEAMDEQICVKLDTITNYFTLINIGSGAEVYKGVNLLGQKEIRKINAVGDLITVTQNTNDISVSIDETELETFVEDLIPNYNAENLGTGAEVFKEETTNTFRFRTITSTDSSVTIVEGTNTIDLSVEATTPTDINITGAGATTVTEPTPNNFVVTSTDTDTIVELQDGVTTEVNGDGVTTPYSVEVLNLQKTISSFPYTLTNVDDKYTIFINNDSSNVVINVPNGLITNFSCVFIQKGIGEVTIQQSGSATVLYPSTTLQNKIKGQYYWAMVEKELSTNNYYLLGSLLTV